VTLSFPSEPRLPRLRPRSTPILVVLALLPLGLLSVLAPAPVAAQAPPPPRAGERPAPAPAAPPDEEAPPLAPEAPGEAPAAPPAPAPVPALALGGAIDLSPKGLEAEIAAVAASLEKTTDAKEKERQEHELKVLRAAEDALKLRAGLEAEEKALAERGRRADEEAARVAEELKRPIDVPTPFPPKALDEAREQERKLRTALDAVEAGLKTVEAAPERIRTELKSLEDRLKELEAGKRELAADLAAAKTDEERSARRRRVAIRDVDVRQHEVRSAYLRDSIELVRKDLPIRRTERETLARRLAIAAERVKEYAKADEQRLAREREAAEAEARAAEVLRKYGTPYEKTLSTLNADLAREKLLHQEEKELSSRWAQRVHDLETRIGAAVRTAAELIERLDDPKVVEARLAVLLARLDEATAGARRFRETVLRPARDEARAVLARLNAAKEDLRDLRARAGPEHEARLARARGQFDELHAKFPWFYTDEKWAQQLEAWAALKEQRTSLIAEREGTIDKAIDSLLRVEELAEGEATRLDEVESLVRSRSFWLRQDPVIDARKLRRAAAAVVAAGRSALDGARRARLRERVAAPGVALRLAAAVAGAILILGVSRRRVVRRLEALLRVEETPPIPLGRRLRRSGLRLLRAPAQGAHLALAALLAFLLQGGEATRIALLASLLLTGHGLASALVRVVLRPYEAAWRLVPLGDDTALLLYRLMRRAIVVTSGFLALWIATVPFEPGLRADLRAMIGLAYRDLLVLIALLSAASPVVTGRILGLFSQAAAARLRRVLVLVGLFFGAGIFAVFALEALGYRNAADSVTRSLAACAAIVAAAIVLDRILYRLVLSRLDPQGVEDDATGAAAAGPASGTTAAPPVGGATRREDPDGARHRFLGELAGTVVGGTVVVSVLFGFLLVFEVERTTVDRLLSTAIVTELTAVGTRALVTVKDVLLALVTLAVTIIVYRYFRRAVSLYVLTRVGLSKGAQFAVTSVAGYTIVGFGVVLALNRLNIHISDLDWFLAAAGVGIGFGLQEILSNFVSGLIILIERPIEVGDIVTIGELEGEITRITIRATTVTTRDNVSIIVPNKEFITSSVTNWSHGDPKVRLKVPIGVAYGSDVSLVRQTLLQVADSYGRILKRPEPQVRFRAFGASSLDFELLVWLASPDPSLRQQVNSDLCAAIDAAFRRSHIEIAFPQLDVHVRQGEPLELAPVAGGFLPAPAPASAPAPVPGAGPEPASTGGAAEAKPERTATGDPERAGAKRAIASPR